MNQGAIVFVGILAVLLWLFLGVFSIIPWQVVGVLVSISIGIPSLLLVYEKEKASITGSSTIIKTKSEGKEEIQVKLQKAERKEQKNTFSALLPDITEITKLKIDDNFLDQIYEIARSEAIKEYDDAQLSYFCVQVFPFGKWRSVNIYFDFYSKWANKICSFQYSSLTSDIKHFKPDKPAKTDLQKGVFDDLPWKTYPHFLQALSMTYDKIKPLPSVKDTYYQISIEGNQKKWYIVFEDGFSGNEYRYYWDGLGLNKTNFKEVH